MTDKITLQQLESFLWETADILRSNIDVSDSKDYIFGLMFLKRLSGSLEEAQEKAVEYYTSKGKSQEQAEKLAQDRVCFGDQANAATYAKIRCAGQLS